MKFEIKNLKDIETLKYSIKKFDSIVIFTKKIKYRGVFHYALKYAFWHLKENGKLLIYDNGPYEILIRPYLFSVYQVNQCVHQFLKSEIKTLKTDFKRGILEYKKKSKEDKNINEGWSAGIIYSGNSNEIELLNNALKGLYKQDEFGLINSEIIICGPTSGDYSFLSQHKDNLKVLYIDDVNKDGRFLISKKKNFLISNFKYENCLLIHARIEFEPNSLKKLDTNFEYVSPQINLQISNTKKRYLDFCHMGSYDSTRITRGKIVSSNYKPSNYLSNLKYGLPYIDGGCMIFKKSILLHIPLNENLAWFENEDVELASRIHNAGYLIDYAYKVKAISNTSKSKGSSVKLYLTRIHPFSKVINLYTTVKISLTNNFYFLKYILLK